MSLPLLKSLTYALFFAGLALFALFLRDDGSVADSTPISTQIKQPVPTGGKKIFDIELPQTLYNDALLRPLFRADRRPFVPPLPSDQLAQETELISDVLPELPVSEIPLQLFLRGVYVSGGYSAALVQTHMSVEAVWCEVGAKIADWTLLSVSAEGAHFGRDGKQLEIKLYVDNSALAVGSQSNQQ